MAKSKLTIENLQQKKTKASAEKKSVEVNTLQTVELAEKPKAKTTRKTKLVVDEKPAKAAISKQNNETSIKEPIKATHQVIDCTFKIHFNTEFGQNLYVIGNCDALGNNQAQFALPMQHVENGIWMAKASINTSINSFTYNYFLQYADGTIIYDAGTDRQVDFNSFQAKQLLLVDAWNHAGNVENAFYTAPFAKVFFNQPTQNESTNSKHTNNNFTHYFSVKFPNLQPNQYIKIVGNVEQLGSWKIDQAPQLQYNKAIQTYAVTVNLLDTSFPITYKYVIVNKDGQPAIYESGVNRLLYDAATAQQLVIVNDGFLRVTPTYWKAAGMAIPVFSLKTNSSWGIGDFNDLKACVDWCKQVGFKVLQLLPINDTTANHTWTDSYPYAAISAFALHPIYLHIPSLVKIKNTFWTSLFSKAEALNKLSDIDYEAVLQLKWKAIQQLFTEDKSAIKKNKAYTEFVAQNKHWLMPYAMFCVLRDTYKTADFNKWETYNEFASIQESEFLKQYEQEVNLHIYVQYLLHQQLLEATEYAHQHGLAVKGDIPIGIYRYGADAWQNPSLYHMDVQAGAPPDDFAVKGQNWGFPTYNWDKMKQDGFAWWKQRFEQMSNYFDAFRIDHILGFFRIWSIPKHAVEGIMGYFVPAIPIRRIEFDQRGINFDQNRLCKPFINDQVLGEIFGYDTDFAKEAYFNGIGWGMYELKNEFKTQKQVEAHFATLEDSDFHNKLKQGLFDIISNVILFEDANELGNGFHFRFNMESTLSFKYLPAQLQNVLRELYINYFYRRQDDFWRQEALQKLPALRRVTNMLICGEDLGMVPTCVPDIMKQLGMLSLEIQRMPKDPKREFFHPNDAPYLSVVTPSTHDMSTIRGWWEEDRAKTQRFYNKELGKWGNAPFYCEDWVCKDIIVQHLYSPAMLVIFQLQDVLAMDAELRLQNPDKERINVPANPKHYWRYRMHISFEELQKQTSYNTNLLGLISESGR